MPRVLGYQPVYADETETVSKSYLPLRSTQVLQFVCDYYGYDGTYSATYLLGNPLAVGDGLTVSDLWVNADRCVFCYCLTDLYGNTFWTESLVAE